MTGNEKLRKENQSLRNEIAELKEKLQKISEEFSSKKAELTKPDAEKKMSSEGANSLEFVSSKYDDLVAFKDEAVKQIKQLFTRVAEISILCDRIAKSIDTLEAYSYQFNVKIVGMPATTQNETSDQTVALCLRLFEALGVEDVSLNDIDIAHRIPSRSASNRPNAIVCKFTRRLAKGKVMAARRRLENLEASQLGFPDDFDISHINLYDHLTPRLQELLFESKKYKNANNFKFCWAKNGAVCLRKTETSTVIKLTSLDELNELRESR